MAGARSRTTVAFTALKNRHARSYLIASGLSMMGDNNEHVITYWVLWQQFHSPALVGFEVISHWLPFLLFSVHFGKLAQRYDCRRLIQAAQALFITVQVSWAVLLLTGTLQIWEACILLVLHGVAGALWGPAEQLMLHDFVDRDGLPGAVRMNATFRSLGVLFGPVVGSVLLLVLGPALALFANVLAFLPMTILMVRTPYTGHTRAEQEASTRSSGAGDISHEIAQPIRRNHLLVGMLMLSGVVAVTIGGSLPVSMPVIASQFTGGSVGFAYGALLLANGLGAVVGGFFLEATGILQPSLRSAVLSTVVLGIATAAVVLVHSYVVVLLALFIAGMASMASMSVAQSVIQMNAPAEARGRIFGLYGLFSAGLRVGNGLTLGLLGAAMGIPSAIALCAVALIAGTAGIALYARGGSQERSRPSL